MIGRIGLLLVFIFCFILPMEGQKMDAFTSPRIDDTMTQNPDQNKKWRKGLYKYGAKPKSAWEMGIHMGHYIIDGDVDGRIPGGFGVGLHLRKAVQYVLSFRIDMFYGQAYGVDAKLWSHSDNGGGLIEPVFDDYQYVSGWFPRVKTHYAYASLQTIINIGNILFHQERNRWNWYLVLGVGLDTHQAMLDLYDSAGNPYDVTVITDKGFDRDIREERIMIKDEVDKFYDGKYETVGPQKEGIFKVADTYNVHMLFVGGMGVSLKINKRINIGLEHQFMATDNDYLDGILYRDEYDQSNNVDIGHYTSLRLGINLGNLEEKTEPLYWLNPLDATFNDIAELKQRPVLDLTDTDADGVIDMLDMEPDSPMGAQVDTRGITSDSDKDGIADFEDKEPYSAPGVKIDSNGQSLESKEEYLNKKEVVNLIEKVRDEIDDSGRGGKGIANWFLPMIHFDLDKYYIKPEFYGDLQHIAEMMKKFPELCVTVSGHTDSRHSNQYNEALSYKRAMTAIDFLVETHEISRDRFRLMYGGEEKPLVPGLASHHNISKEKETAQYINRRVEFRVCEETDFDMAAPEFLDAGQNSYGSSRKGPKYSGNNKSGY